MFTVSPMKVCSYGAVVFMTLAPQLALAQSPTRSFTDLSIDTHRRRRRSSHGFQWQDNSRTDSRRLDGCLDPHRRWPSARAARGHDPDNHEATARSLVERRPSRRRRGGSRRHRDRAPELRNRRRGRRSGRPLHLTIRSCLCASAHRACGPSQALARSVQENEGLGIVTDLLVIHGLTASGASAPRPQPSRLARGSSDPHRRAFEGAGIPHSSCACRAFPAAALAPESRPGGRC